MSMIENRISSLTSANYAQSPANGLAQQVRSRMAELAKTVDAEGTTSVKLNKDGTYDISSESQDENAEILKSRLAKTFSDDETLTSLIKEYQTQYQAMLKKDAQTPTGSQNADKAEISDEARAKLEQANQERGVEGNYGPKHQFTMKIDMDIVERNEPPVALANRYFFSFSNRLQSAAQETGEFENDFVINFNEKNELVISEVTGKSGAVENEKTAEERSRIESLLESINEAMKKDADASDSDLVKTLRRFIDVAGRADASQEDTTTKRLYTLPFTIWGSTSRG